MFNKLSLKFKILLIVVPLAFCLLLACTQVITFYYKQGQQLKGLVKVSKTFDRFGALINQLQIERGKSSLFLNNKISLDELNNHKTNNTDKEILKSRTMIAALPFPMEHSVQVSDAFEEINATRKGVETKSLTPAEAITSYSHVIQEILIAEGRAATLFSGKGIEIKLINMTLVESIKESMGVSRASFSGVFAANTPISNKDLEKLFNARASIQSVRKSPSLELMPTLNEKLGEVFLSTDWKAVNKDMNKVLEKATIGDYGVESKPFFEKISGVIEVVNSLIKDERLSIIKLAENEASHSQIVYYSVLIAILFILTGLTFFSWKVIQDVVRREVIEAIANVAASRSASMVDNSPTSTMMCDTSGHIIYLNKSSIENFAKLQQYLPVKVDKLIGTNIDTFHKNPGVQRKIISDPRNLPHTAICTIGPETVELLITASINSEGKYLGTGVSWSIVTAKVELIRDLTRASTDLGNAATNVLSISSNLSAAAEETSAQANTASVASEEVNAGVQTVASNMGEMVSAIKEITQTTNEAAVMSNEAMKLSKNANQMINKLGESSVDIGNVIKVISSIAQQTNLLALNATIEAARAGEAGKGFAVVANEVKELAKQTATATNEITKKIEAIQTDSQGAINAIADITSAIEKVNGFTGNIAAAVEQQSATTNEVTRIVSESAEGVKQINENISQVSHAAASTGKDAGHAQAAAKGVGEIANQLKTYVARLKVE